MIRPTLLNCIKILYDRYYYRLLLGIALVWVTLGTHLTEWNIQQVGPAGVPPQWIQLPYHQTSPPLPAGQAAVLYRFSWKTRYNRWLSPSQFRLIADNCLSAITVNEQPVDLSSFSQDQLCNISRGIRLDLAPYLQSGLENTIVVEIADTGVIYGLTIKHTWQDIPFALFLACTMGLLILGSYPLLRRLELPAGTGWLLLGAALIRIIYYDYTPFEARNHDAAPHLEYVQLMIEQHGWVDKVAAGCYQPTSQLCYHPSLYYELAAIIYTLAESLHWQNPAHALQLFSVFLSLVFVTYALRLLALFLPNNTLFYLAASLVAFWPTGIMYSVAVANDGLLFTEFIMALYYLARWVQQPQPRWLYYAAGLTVLAMFTKSNAVLLVATMVLTVFLHIILNPAIHPWWRWPPTSPPRWLIISAGLLGLSLFSLLEPLGQYLHGNSLHLLSGNWGVGGIIRENDLETTPRTFFYFDTRLFMAESFANPGWLEAESEPLTYTYHWNFLLKSAILESFGVLWNYDNTHLALNQRLAQLMGIAWLVIVLYAAAQVILLTHARLQQYLVPQAAFMILLIGSMGYRLTAPSTLASNFKYIFPVIVIFMLLYSVSLYRLQQKGYWALTGIGYLAGYSLCGLSLAFFLTNSYLWV